MNLKLIFVRSQACQVLYSVHIHNGHLEGPLILIKLTTINTMSADFLPHHLLSLSVTIRYQKNISSLSLKNKPHIPNYRLRLTAKRRGGGGCGVKIPSIGYDPNSLGMDFISDSGCCIQISEG